MILPYLFIHMDETRLYFLCIVVIFGRNYCVWTQTVIVRETRLYGLSAALRIHITTTVNRGSTIFLGPFIVKFPFAYTRVLHGMFIVFKSDYSEIVQSIPKVLILKH
jgi:hypothetical protein